MDVGDCNYLGDQHKADMQDTARKLVLTVQDDSLVYKKDSRVERILDLTQIPSTIESLQQKIMHLLSNMNFIIQADVYKM